MIEVVELHSTDLAQDAQRTQPLLIERELPDKEPKPGKFYLLKQLLQFGMVGGLNTLLDILILNVLLLLFPTTSTPQLLAYNALAFSIGAINSFVLNKYWTFKYKQRITLKEVSRYVLSTMFGIVWSTLVLWIASTVLHPLAINATLWANTAKLVSVASSAVLSYLGMRLWVFVQPARS